MICVMLMNFMICMMCMYLLFFVMICLFVYSVYNCYVYDFYGKNGIYDMGATVSQIQTATIDYIASDDSLPFYGDSLDRERVRDILTSKFNLKEVI